MCAFEAVRAVCAMLGLEAVSALEPLAVCLQNAYPLNGDRRNMKLYKKRCLVTCVCACVCADCEPEFPCTCCAKDCVKGGKRSLHREMSACLLSFASSMNVGVCVIKKRI